MNVTPEAVADCRDRDGTAADERPEYVAEYFADSEVVGYQNELPLVGDSYAEYRTGDELLRPDAGDTLEAVASHELTATVDDVAKELDSSVQTVEKGADLHGVELPDGTDDGETEVEVITLPDGEEWQCEHLAKPAYSDPRVLSALLAHDGLSLTETVEYLNEELDSDVKPPKVRQAAINCGLLDGERKTDDSGSKRLADDDVRLGGQTIDYSDSNDSIMSGDGWSIE